MSYNRIPALAISAVLIGAALYPTSVGAENKVLSLLWSGAVSPDNFGKKSTTVRSGYDYETSSGQKFEWRADEDSPLVIYDPRQRKVVSEETLIGVWTYGGRNYKNPDAPRVPWSDAYEALATLDKNRDYSVSGRELHVVSLWFDRNRDGQAQGDEVVPASTIGLAEIALRGQPLLLPDGSRYYRQGFRRFKMTGEIITGSSITWTIEKLDRKPPVTVAAEIAAGIKVKGEHSRFNGFWRFIDNFDAQSDVGSMHLEVLEDGSVRGTSVSSPDRKADSDPVTTARLVTITGQVTGDRGDQVTLKMLTSGQDQSTSCVASMIERDGKTFLKGSSVSQIVDADGEQREMGCDWLAERPIEPQ